MRQRDDASFAELLCRVRKSQCTHEDIDTLRARVVKECLQTTPRMLSMFMGAKVMLTVNIDVSNGLVNGARVTVKAIIKTGNQVSLLLVQFEHDRVGVKAKSHSHYREEHPNAVPINRHEAVFNNGRNRAAEVSRRQFPLVLAWATTIHKVQGLTLDQIVVDMKGKAFNAGQAYVALSRVKSQHGLFILNSTRTASNCCVRNGKASDI